MPISTGSMTLLVIVVMSGLLPRSSSMAASAPSVCHSEGCVSAGVMLQRNVDMQVDPCQDFYSFACGGSTRKKSQLPSYTAGLVSSASMTEEEKLNDKLLQLFNDSELVKSQDAEMQVMYDAVRKVFNFCAHQFREQNATDLLEPIIKELGRSLSLEDFLTTLIKKQISGFIQLASFEGFDDLELAKEILPLIAMRKDGPIFAVKTLQFNAADHLNVEFKVPATIRQAFQDAGSPLTSTDHELALELEKLRRLNRTGYVTQFVADLQPITDTNFTFDWQTLIDKVHSGPHDIQYIGVERYLEFMPVLKNLSEQLAAKSGSLYDLIRVEVLMAIEKEMFSDSPDIQSYCVQMTRKFMKPVVHDMFKRAYIQTDDFSRIDSLISEVKEAMKQNVDEEHWIKAESKEAIKAKIDNMKHVISYPELPTAEIISMFRPPMELFKMAKSAGDIAMVYQDAAFRQQLWFLTTATPLYIAFAAVQDVFQFNAFYNPIFNSIHIYLGFIDSFLYNKDCPEHVLYGSLGEIVGHEIGHGLDPQCSTFDANGNFGDSIYDPETFSAYASKMMCLIKSYNRINISSVTKVNGTATLNENFSDIVGLNAAFRAYKNSRIESGTAERQLPGKLSSMMTPHQLFFVQVAQMNCKSGHNNYNVGDQHSPPKARVLGGMMHSSQFAGVFQCRPGHSMHLSDEHRCHLW